MPTTEESGWNPCINLAIEIGAVAKKIADPTPDCNLTELETKLAVLTREYYECTHWIIPTVPRLGPGLGGHTFVVEELHKTKFIRVTKQPGLVQWIIIGGNDGVLITIDVHGTIRVTPPEGPGDPEVRIAVNNSLEGLAALTKVLQIPSQTDTAGAIA